MKKIFYLLSVYLFGFSFSAYGDVNLNICERLLEDVFIPPVVRKVTDCDTSFAKCIAMPHCCIPVACKALPDCVIETIVEDVAGYVAHRGDIYCSVQNISAERFFSKWMKGEITNFVHLLSLGLPQDLLTYFNTKVDLIATQSSSIPNSIQGIIRQTIRPFRERGQSKFDYNDITDAKIISHSRAKKFFFSNEESVIIRAQRAAITLGPVIVMRDDFYQELTSPKYNNINLESINNTESYQALIRSLETLTHELVHIRQYREFGRQSFLTNYALSHLAQGGYGHDSFEKEAYLFSANIAEFHGGSLCYFGAQTHNYFIREFSLPIAPVKCLSNTLLKLSVQHAGLVNQSEGVSSNMRQRIYLRVENLGINPIYNRTMNVAINGVNYEGEVFNDKNAPLNGGKFISTVQQGSPSGSIIINNIKENTFSHCQFLNISIKGNVNPIPVKRLYDVNENTPCGTVIWGPTN